MIIILDNVKTTNFHDVAAWKEILVNDRVVYHQGGVF